MGTAAVTVSAAAPLWRLKAVTLHPEDEFLLKISLDPAPSQQEEHIDFQLQFETVDGAARALQHLEASRDLGLARLWSELEAFILQESAAAVARTEEMAATAYPSAASGGSGQTQQA